jgi:hypothetical protein
MVSAIITMVRARMYRMEEMNDDPTAADVGQFIPQRELTAWFQMMQQDYPEVFRSDDTLFGIYPDQHAFNQKLMAFFDNDPNKPMKCQVKGTRWIDEGLLGLTPMYVMMMGGKLSQIPFTSAHEEAGWKRGWDVPPPPGAQ